MKNNFNKRIISAKLSFLCASAVSLICLFLTVNAFSQDTIQKKRILLNGYVKDLQTFIFQDIGGPWTTANMIHNRLNFKWLPSDQFLISIEMRNRFLFGNLLNTYPGYADSFEADHGITSLSENVINERDFLLNIQLDRAYVGYTGNLAGNVLQVTAGRQRINWGQAFVWNPNDLFNVYSYFEFDYEEKPGSDAIRIQYFSGAAAGIELAAKIDDSRKVTAAGLYRFNTRTYDFQFLGGIAGQEDFVLGAGWSGSLFKGGFRGEGSWFMPIEKQNNEAGIFLMSACYDYTFKNSLFLQLEGLYNGNDDSLNVIDIAQPGSTEISTKNLFLPGYSVFSALTYPFTPLFSGSLAGIVNFKSNVFFINPTLNISLTENLELTFTGQCIRFYAAVNSAQNVNFLFGRVKYSF